ncbi:MAG: hypothetical protein EXR73_03665 [Myxococcales bacterium]|nr:hypothetical protein [Myxococcales bacterium]
MISTDRLLARVLPALVLALPMLFGACKGRSSQPQGKGAAPAVADAAAKAAPAEGAPVAAGGSSSEGAPGVVSPGEGAPPGVVSPGEGAPPGDTEPNLHANDGRPPGSTPVGELAPPEAEKAARSTSVWTARCAATPLADPLSAFACPRLALTATGPRYGGAIRAVATLNAKACDEISDTPYDQKAGDRRTGCKLAVGLLSVVRNKDRAYCDSLAGGEKRFSGAESDTALCLKLLEHATKGLDEATARRDAKTLFGAGNRLELAVAAFLGKPSHCAVLKGIDERLTCLAYTGGVSVDDLSQPGAIYRLIDGTTFYE